jgi:hypothetical protein
MECMEVDDKAEVAKPGKASPNTVRWIPLNQIDPHPANPPSRYADDDPVVQAAAADFKAGGKVPAEVAIRVRPLNGRFEVVGGHRRYRGAILAGLTRVPCWVRKMTDQQALMTLAKDNEHDRFSPLEVGDLIIEAKKEAKARGKNLTVKRWAEVHHKNVDTVEWHYRAAKVARAIEPFKVKGSTAPFDQILNGIASQLAVIHRAPKDKWRELVENVAGSDMSVRQTEAMVKKAQGKTKPDPGVLPPIYRPYLVGDDLAQREWSTPEGFTSLEAANEWCRVKRLEEGPRDDGRVYDVAMLHPGDPGYDANDAKGKGDKPGKGGTDKPTPRKAVPGANATPEERLRYRLPQLFDAATGLLPYLIGMLPRDFDRLCDDLKVYVTSVRPPEPPKPDAAPQPTTDEPAAETVPPDATPPPVSDPEASAEDRKALYAATETESVVQPIEPAPAPVAPDRGRPEWAIWNVKKGRWVSVYRGTNLPWLHYPNEAQTELEQLRKRNPKGEYVARSVDQATGTPKEEMENA